MRASAFSMDGLAAAEARDVSSMHSAYLDAENILKQRELRVAGEAAAGARGAYPQSQHGRRLQAWNEYEERAQGAGISAVQWEREQQMRPVNDHQQKRDLKKHNERQAFLRERERLSREALAQKDAVEAQRAQDPRRQHHEWAPPAAIAEDAYESATQATYKAWYARPENEVAAGGYRKERQLAAAAPPQARPDELSYDDEQQLRQHQKQNYADAQFERARRNWKSSIVLGDDSSAGAHPAAMYSTTASEVQSRAASAHGTAVQRHEDEQVLAELMQVHGYSPEEAKYELYLYRSGREPQGMTAAQEQQLMRQQAVEPKVPNFMKRQMMQQQGQTYDPKATHAKAVQARAGGGAPPTAASYPRANRSSQSGGIFAGQERFVK